MRFTTVLLDADDTIFDFGKCENTAFHLTVNEVGLTYSDKLYQSFSEINNSLWKLLEKGGVTKPELKLQRFKKMMEQNFSAIDKNQKENISEKLAKSYVEFLSQQNFLIDGTYEALEKISSLCDIYIITNGVSYVQRGRLKNSEVLKFFNDIFISDEVGYEKPDKRYFDYVLENIKEKNKNNIIVVGDSLTSDMRGGKNAGLTTCIFDRKDMIEMPHILCDMKILNLGQLLDICKGDKE